MNAGIFTFLLSPVESVIVYGHTSTVWIMITPAAPSACARRTLCANVHPPRAITTICIQSNEKTDDDHRRRERVLLLTLTCHRYLILHLVGILKWFGTVKRLCNDHVALFKWLARPKVSWNCDYLDEHESMEVQNQSHHFSSASSALVHIAYLALDALHNNCHLNCRCLIGNERPQVFY